MSPAATATVTARYALQTDALGSVVAISSEGGLPVATYAYDPWGAPLATTLVITSALDRAVVARQPFRYRGYTLDAETGLYYLPARYYDPAAARFLSPDPAAPSAGDPASLNPYVYCQDDPIGASDPTGAIMTLDDDGRVAAYEAAAYAASRAKHNKKLYAHFMGRAKSQHKKWLAQRKAASDAIALFKEMAREKARGDALSARNARQCAIADTYDPATMELTQPGTADYIVTGIGVACDALTLTPLAPIALGVGIVVDLAWTVAKVVQATQGKATGGDIALAAASIIPGVSTVAAVEYAGDAMMWDIDYAETRGF